MIRWFLIVVLAVGFVGVAVTSSSAEECIFVAPADNNWSGVGDWHVAKNWSCGRIPTEDDEVFIPEKTWCTIRLADDGWPGAICRTLNVATGAKLTNLENTLVIGDDDEPTVSVVNGVIEGREPNGYPPSAKMVCRGVTTITGTGVLEGSKANGPDYHLSIRCCGTGLGPCQYSTKLVIIEDGITLHGDIRFNGICLRFNGTAIVDYPGDTMELMPGGGGMICGRLCNEPMSVTGRGRFVVEAGTLRIGLPKFPRCNKIPSFELAGGEIIIGHEVGCGFSVTFTGPGGKLTMEEGQFYCQGVCSRK